MPLDVSLNGQQFDALGTYTYYQKPAFDTLTPPSGPSLGGTLVVVAGPGVAANELPPPDGEHQYFCRFGRNPKVAGSFFPPHSLRCVSPAAVDDPGPEVTVSITLNDQDYAASYHFMYYNEPSILSITPRTGPAPWVDPL